MYRGLDNPELAEPLCSPERAKGAPAVTRVGFPTIAPGRYARFPGPHPPEPLRESGREDVPAPRFPRAGPLCPQRPSRRYLLSLGEVEPEAAPGAELLPLAEVVGHLGAGVARHQRGAVPRHHVLLLSGGRHGSSGRAAAERRQRRGPRDKGGRRPRPAPSARPPRPEPAAGPAPPRARRPRRPQRPRHGRGTQNVRKTRALNA